MASETVERDYSAPPCTEFEGRKFTAEIEFCLVEEATDEQIQDWLEFELGGVSISQLNPLVEAGAYPNRLVVTNLHRSNMRLYTDWGETSKDGRRSGRGRVEFDERVSS